MPDKQTPRPSIAGPESTPSFTCEQAEAIVFECYGVKASASELPSERDQNFRIKSEDGKNFVLKIPPKAAHYAGM